MQSLGNKIFLIQVLNFKQLCWLTSNNTRQEWLHFVDKWLAAVQIYCCESTLIKHSSAVLQPPPKSSGAISSLMCHLPSIQNPWNLTGIAKCVVRLYLFSSLLLLLLFLWMRNLLFFLKGAQGKEEIATGAISTLFPSDGKPFACNGTPLVLPACVWLALSVPRSRSRRALRAWLAAAPGQWRPPTSGSPYLPILSSCLTGLSDPIHHVCDNLTEAIDWERVD